METGSVSDTTAGCEQYTPVQKAAAVDFAMIRSEEGSGTPYNERADKVVRKGVEHGFS